jgi:hypothetical protein
MGVLSRRKILAPAMRGNRALHDLAMVGWLELQTNLATLLAVLGRLILGIGMGDLLRFARFLLGASRGDHPTSGRSSNSDGARENISTRNTLAHPYSHAAAASRFPGPLFRDELFLGLRDVPEHYVIVRVRHTRMAGVVVDADVIDVTARRRKLVPGLLGIEILERNHVDCAHEFPGVVIGKERSSGRLLGST